MGYYIVKGTRGRKQYKSVVRTPLKKTNLERIGRRSGYSKLNVSAVKQSTAWTLARKSKKKYTAYNNKIVGFRL